MIHGDKICKLIFTIYPTERAKSSFYFKLEKVPFYVMSYTSLIKTGFRRRPANAYDYILYHFSSFIRDYSDSFVPNFIRKTPEDNQDQFGRLIAIDYIQHMRSFYRTTPDGCLI
jgi:hypothetical protein